ncbi:uncharacterized protein GJ701_012755 isoform 1-T1 [Geothlypis trichas]
MRGPLLWAGWLLATGCLLGATGSCRHRCCPGRNNACWAPGARRARCYCDSYCQRTGDCCQDYPTSCRRAAVGCTVGPWGPWSGCSSPCGVGSRARSRQVTVPPRHGGDPCPDLKQRRGCLGQHPTCGTAQGNGAACCPPACCLRVLPSRGVFNHPRVPHSCSCARGSQDSPQLLQPGLQRSLAKSWAATAGGALWVRVGSGPLCNPRPQSRDPSCTPAVMASLHPRFRAILFPPAIAFLPALNHGPVAPPYKTMALCMPHKNTILPALQTRIPLQPPEPSPFPLSQPSPLCHPPNPHPLYTPIHQQSTSTSALPSDHHFPSFLLPCSPSPAPAAISA